MTIGKNILIVALAVYLFPATAVCASEQDKCAGDGMVYIDDTDIEGIIYSVDTPAEFIGGKDSLYSFFVKNFKLISVTDVCVEKLFVDFWVNPDSSVVHVRVETSNPALEAEVVRVVTLTSGHWKPATKKNRPVAQKLRLPILFTPSKDK
ncbi:MAG: energy transducer TonB [Paludibacteraceae bacterium]|nr:energy transducer TonB [Paludibacteraceae bacterium]